MAKKKKSGKAEQRRKEHYKKRVQKEKRKQKQEGIAYFWYLVSKTPYLILFLIIAGVFVAISVHYENPILIAILWKVVYDVLCENALGSDKKFKSLKYIPIFELFMFAAVTVMLCLGRTNNMLDFIGMLGLLCGVFNGISYLIYRNRIY